MLDATALTNKTQLSKEKLMKKENTRVISLMSRLTKIFTGGKQNVTLTTVNANIVPNTSMTQREVHKGPLKKNVDWYNVELPSYASYSEARTQEAQKNNQTPDQEMVYRLYKGSNWHEDQHVRYTAPEAFRNDAHDSKTRQDLYNIIDDRRIEELGVNALPGFVPIRLLRQSYWHTLRPDVGMLAKRYTDEDEMFNQLKPQLVPLAAIKFATKTPTEEQIKQIFDENKDSLKQTMRKNAVIEAFLQRMLQNNKQKGLLPNEDQEKLEKVTEEIQNELSTKYEDPQQDSKDVYKGLRGLISKFMTAMNIQDDCEDKVKGNRPDPHSQGKGQPGGSEGFDPEQIEKVLLSITPDKETPREDGDPGTVLTKEDIEKALKGTPRDSKELQEIKTGKGRKEDERDEDPTAPQEFDEPENRADPSIYRDKKFIDKMNELLTEWRQGYKRTFGKMGAMLNLQRSYASHGERAFQGRVRVDASKTKTLFVLDMSYSMSPRQEDYKRVLGSTMEVLDGIKAQTAIYGFGELTADFFKLKDFRQKWNRTRQEELAGMEASGGTPLVSTLQMLEPYIEKQRPDYTVIITDGDPTDGDPTEEIKKLRKSTHFVGFGLGGTDIAEALKRFGVAESFSTNDVREIPKKLIPKIAPIEQ